MTQDEYEARILFERWQARVWLAEKLLEARRRYWTLTEDPILREGTEPATPIEWRVAMSALDPATSYPIVTVLS